MCVYKCVRVCVCVLGGLDKMCVHELVCVCMHMCVCVCEGDLKKIEVLIKQTNKKDMVTKRHEEKKREMATKYYRAKTI